MKVKATAMNEIESGDHVFVHHLNIWGKAVNGTREGDTVIVQIELEAEGFKSEATQ